MPNDSIDSLIKTIVDVKIALIDLKVIYNQDLLESLDEIVAELKAQPI